MISNLAVEGGKRLQSPVRAGEAVAGKYRVDAILGSGGNGVVVAAMHVVLRTRVAIKFLGPEAPKDDVAAARRNRLGSLGDDLPRHPPRASARGPINTLDATYGRTREGRVRSPCALRARATRIRSSIRILDSWIPGFHENGALTRAIQIRSSGSAMLRGDQAMTDSGTAPVRPRSMRAAATKVS
jgi:serine/threonine protein kinase